MQGVSLVTTIETLGTGLEMLAADRKCQPALCDFTQNMTAKSQVTPRLAPDRHQLDIC